ncbi:hypothetical protein T03_1234 [Trichinella britovi]|uniref:FLYWCH-type domain-containing protein n=1 Tax=Trichinella britovi TaxID=45882 RepID=A0A0V1CIB5_TRIBR|nr:hypothetical protein T03_1234 [Trichinella britovi]
MADNLHLVLNERVHEGRVYNLKRTNMEDKQWVCRRVKKGCRDSIYTNLDVNGILSSDSHADDCTPDNDILYKMEKKNALKRRAAEEMKTAPQICREASSASAGLETAVLKRRCTKNGHKNFQDFRQLASSWRFHPTGEWRSLIATFYNLIFCTEENLSILSDHSVWSMDGTFKIVPEWYQQMFTIHVFIAGAVALRIAFQPQTIICDFETALIPALSPHTGLFLPLLPVLWKVTDLGMRTSYIHEASTKKIVKMLLVMASLPLRDVPAAVELLGRDATGSIKPLFNYFRVEWMPYDRLPLWNVYNVNIGTNNDLEGWHFKMNRLAGKRHLSFYELLQLLIDEQGSTETLIQQYEELQKRITALTAEYDGGTRTMEQFLGAVHLTYYLRRKIIECQPFLHNCIIYFYSLFYQFIQI